jgi:ribosome maturation factor RimP
VSSPGLGRQLKRDKHFEKSIGEEVEVKLYKALNKKKEFTGILSAFDQSTITIELEDHSTMVIPRTDIATVRLTFDF